MGSDCWWVWRFPFEVLTMSWDEREVDLHNIVNVLHATGSVTLKCLTLYYVNFTSVRKT